MLPFFSTAQGVTILGPGLIPPGQERGIGTVIPRFDLVSTGPGTHWDQIVRAAEFLAGCGAGPGPDARDLIREAVCLYVPGDVMEIRSTPDDMDLTFAADRILQKLVPRSLIHFLGLEHSAVRRALRRRGESWRMAPPPLTPEAVDAYIRKNRIRVSTPVNYHYNPTTGVRILTCQEFRKIGPLLIQNRADAQARLWEISELAFRKNRGGHPEVAFFLAPGKSLPPELLAELGRAVRDPAQGPDRVLAAYRALEEEFLAAAGELADDDPRNPAWRSAMFHRVSNLQEARLEESALGLSPEFHLNIRWLPGACIENGRAVFDPEAGARARNLILHFLLEFPDLASINLGRVESPQTHRITTGQEREVLVAAVETAQGGVCVRVLREAKWNVAHRIKLGTDLSRAIAETHGYRDYVMDRLAAVRALSIPIPVFTEIGFQEAETFSLPLPVYYFSRPYVPGVATDKVPAGLYRNPGFIPALARLLGYSAAVSLVLGRADEKTGRLFFDDGDEMVRLDADGIPRQILLAETTGSFFDTKTPFPELLPQLAERLAGRLAEALRHGAPEAEVLASARAFGQGLAEEIAALKERLAAKSPELTNFFAHRTDEEGGIRRRWESALARLRGADPVALGRLAGQLALDALGTKAGREPG